MYIYILMYYFYFIFVVVVLGKSKRKGNVYFTEMKRKHVDSTKLDKAERGREREFLKPSHSSEVGGQY